MRDRARSDGARKASEKRKLESDSIEENIAKSQRLTSGVLTQNGVHSWNDPRFLDPFRQRQTEAAKKLEEKATKTKALSKKRYDEVKALRAKYGGEKSHLLQTVQEEDGRPRNAQRCCSTTPEMRRMNAPSVSPVHTVPQ
jgi:hypothetical protein